MFITTNFTDPAGTLEKCSGYWKERKFWREFAAKLQTYMTAFLITVWDLGA